MGATVGLVTYSGMAGISSDDVPLRSALLARAVDVRVCPWDHPAIDWATLDLCVIRSTWNYQHLRPAYLRWAECVSRTTSLWNPLELIRWNTHKRYLRDLEEQGVPIVPTAWLPRHAAVDLGALLADRQWEQAVVKPAVSASAERTILVRTSALETGQDHLNGLLKKNDVMVQPFMSSVLTSGERSLLVIDGELTHAVRRGPMLPLEARADFAVLAAAEDDEIALARAALRLVSPRPLYARVDIVRDHDDQVRLLELELVEPSLFLGEAPIAAERLADAIMSRVSAGGSTYR